MACFKTSMSLNENTMTNFEVNNVKDKIKTNYAMEISDEDGMFQNLSISINNLDEHIDSTISSTYTYFPGSLHKQWSSKFYNDFANSLSLRGEISKTSASIGSCNASSEDCELFQYPSVTTITNLEYNREGIFGPYHVQAIISSVSDVEVNRPSGIKQTYTSKLCIIS